MNGRIAKAGLVALAMTLGAGGAAGAEPAAAEKPVLVPAQPEAVQRWQAMRFGMFIHWGPVSLKGTEIGWSRGAQIPLEEYDSLYKQFNPTNFDADAWVKTAKDAGMKYMVLTTKHHDGFCLWDTKQTDYNIMNSPFARDVVKELAAACRRGGLAFGTYYSTCDWHHPSFTRGSPGGKTKNPNPDMDRYTAYLRGQVTELIRNYGPLLTIWFDVPQDTGPERGIPTCNLVRSLQPDILINNRAGGTPGDYDTPEQKIGGFQIDRPWETCMTICHQWAWKPDDAMKSLEQCLQTLVRTAGGDGNLLFNVGPMPDGRIEPRQVERLKEMGAWLVKYGDSLYGTRGGPFKPGAWGASTRRDKTVFVHVLKWEGDEALTLPAIPAKVVSARALNGAAVECKQTPDALVLSVAAAARDPIDTVIALELDCAAMELAPVGTTAASLVTGAKATASNVYQGDNQYAAAKAVDGDEDSRWATDAGTKSAWLELDLGQAKTFSRLAIREWAEEGGRIRSFQLKVKDGGDWKTVLEGTTVGAKYAKAFPAVTAQVVRLEIAEATDGPTIEEISLLK